MQINLGPDDVLIVTAAAELDAAAVTQALLDMWDAMDKEAIREQAMNRLEWGGEQDVLNSAFNVIREVIAHAHGLASAPGDAGGGDGGSL